MHERNENTHRISVIKAAGKRLLEKTRCRWEGNVKDTHKEIMCESVG
jgi:hypothetical protein